MKQINSHSHRAEDRMILIFDLIRKRIRKEKEKIKNNKNNNFKFRTIMQDHVMSL